MIKRRCSAVKRKKKRPLRQSANALPFLQLVAAGEKYPQSDAGIFALGGQGIAASRRRGAKGDRTPRFPIPSSDSPTFLWPLSAAFAAKKRGTQLRPLYHRRRFDAVWGWLRPRFPRIQVRGSGVQGDMRRCAQLSPQACVKVGGLTKRRNLSFRLCRRMLY